MLNIVSKIAKKHMRALLEPLILQKLGNHQFGFLRGRSTEDALLFAEHTIKTMMSVGIKPKGTVCGISFDIAKAFDTVPFVDLLNCLRDEYNVSACLISWLGSYFQDGTQAVRVQGSYSSARQVRAGVVQGSVICPLLFAAHLDRVAHDNFGSATTVKFADDLLLLHPVNNEADEVAAQAAIDTVAEVVRSKHLKINGDKCCFGTYFESSRPYVITSPLKVNGVPIQQAEEGLPYLGALIDFKLNWTLSSQAAVGKAKRSVGTLPSQFCPKIN